MYPKNAASPPRIAVGAVIQISDGAVQSAGVSVVVRPEGGEESAGGGTIAYSAASNLVYYTPTQAETDYTAFAVVAYKTGCIPVGITVVTTASSVPGRTMPADGSVTAAVIATDAIDADSLKTDAVTEIQSGLALAETALSNVQWTNALATALASTNTDWANGGRLDLILDIIAADTTTDIPTLINALNNLSAAQVTAAVPTVLQIQSGLATPTNITAGTITTVTTLTNLPSITTDWISAAGVSAAAGAKLADISRRRTQANVEVSSDGDTLSVGSLYGLIQQAQESNATAAAGFLTIYKTDGSTSLGTKVLSTNASADPVDGIS